jgi:hypothetical protein
MPLSPEERARFDALVKNMTMEANSTKTKAENRREFERRIGKTTPTSEIVAKIEAAQAVVWAPRAYVLFVRAAHCKNCGERSRVLDYPRLFLEEVPVGRTEGNPIRYVPTTEIEFHKFPRRKVVNFVTTPFCLSCFEAPSCPSTSSSEQGAIESPIVEQDQVSLQSLEPSNLQMVSDSMKTHDSQPSTNGAEFAGSPSEVTFGSECDERNFPTAIAER